MLKIVLPLVLVLMFSHCATNEKSSSYSKTESLLKGYYTSENLKDVSSIFIVGDNGCQLCYSNLEIALKEKDNSILLYYSSNNKIGYQKTIFKKYLPESKIKIIYQRDILDHISENYGFIKSFVEIELSNEKVSNLIIHN